ncbi:MAG: type II secretion system protein GspL [Burkholderiaceae bacterium]|nr:type II secretion system protein GspL [Burkholderiaceae bacterium]
MSILVIALAPRPRIRARSVGLDGIGMGQPSPDDEFEYVLSRDGLSIQAQGRCGAAALPQADSVVAVVSEADVAWHRITLPKAPASRLRAALSGVLEEAVLADTDATHFALAPDATAGRPTWIAAIDRAWLQAELERLERQQVFVDRVVPMAWPDDPPSGHFAETPADSEQPEITLTWSHTDGVAMLRLQGSLARSLLPHPAPTDVRWTAAAEAVTAAERWLGAPVLVVSKAERALQATRTLWNLRQFDLAARHRGTRAARDLVRQWLSPAWRPVRLGVMALAVVQVIGLNLWAWHQSAEVARQKRATMSLLQSTFPQVRAVLDAPLQMQHEVEALRTQAGKPSETDFEPLLRAAASAWPVSQPPVNNLRFEPGRLTLAAPGWAEADIEQFRSRLRPAGWTVDAAEGQVSLSRPAGRPTP